MLQPSAIHVHEHFVTSYDDWPSPIREFCHAALASDSAKHPSSSASELSSFLSEGLSILQRVDQPWETVRKTSLTLPFVLDGMCAAAQTGDTSVEWRFHANPVFMMPIDPCCFDDPNARFQPPYCIADAIFTSAVYLESDDGCEDGELGSSDDTNSLTEDEVYTPALSNQTVDVSMRMSNEAFLMHKENQSVDESSAKDTYSPSEMSVGEDCVEAGELDPGDVDAESSEPDTEEGPTPQDHAQLLFGQAADVLEAAVACVASSADAYTVLASCLLQRHSLGLRGPLVVVVVDKYETTVSLVFGWVQPSTNNCVDVHAAHARSASGQVSNPCAGLFDLSHISDSARLHGVLQAIIELGHRDIDEALVRIASEGVRKVNVRWRLDLAGLIHPKDEADREDSALERVRRWLASSSEPASSSQQSCSSMSSPFIRNSIGRSAQASSIPGSTATMSEKSDTNPASGHHTFNTSWTRIILIVGHSHPSIRNSSSVWLCRLSPCQAMELGRLVIPTVFPQTAYDVKCFPHLQPCAAVVAYFDPVKLPNEQLSIHDDSIFRRYQDHCDKHDQSRALMESRYHPDGGGLDRKAANITEAQKSAIEHKFSLCFGPATRISQHARRFDRNATGELTEGGGIQGRWDAIHVLGLLHQDASDVELDVGFEKQIQMPQHDAYLDTAEDANRVFDFAREAFDESECNSLFRKFYKSCAEMIPIEPPSDSEGKDLPAELQNTGLSRNDIANVVASQAHAAERIVLKRFDERRKQMSAWRGLGFESMLCRIREEPSRARCDVVAALRVRDVFNEESEGEGDRVRRFNFVLCEGQESPETQAEGKDTRLDMAGSLAYRKNSVEERKAGPCPSRFTGRVGLVQLTRAMAESVGVDDDDAEEEGTGIGIEGAREAGKVTLAGGDVSGGGDARLGLGESTLTLGRWDQVDLEGVRGRQGHALASSTTVHARRSTPSHSRSRSLTLGVYSAETNVDGKDFGQCVYQGVMNTLAGVKQLAAVGIRAFPVFCSVIDGRTAHVLCGWSASAAKESDGKADLPSREGLAKPVVVYMSYWDDTPTYDLTNPMETLRFCGFLLHIRYVHAPRLRQEFEEVRGEFVRRWKDGSDELNWTLGEQKRVVEEHLEALERKIEGALGEIRAEGV